jgi:hypothetical protein
MCDLMALIDVHERPLEEDDMRSIDEIDNPDGPAQGTIHPEPDSLRLPPGPAQKSTTP